MPYPEVIPVKIPFHHEGTVSSSGKQTTSQANQEFDFSTTPLNSLEVTAHATDIHIKINAETNTHLVQAGQNITFSQMMITDMTIVEDASEYSYSGAYYVDLS